MPYLTSVASESSSRSLSTSCSTLSMVCGTSDGDTTDRVYKTYPSVDPFPESALPNVM